jgi:predicted DCC family thiol-disulfide oxidoreductase YuxK
VAKDFLAVLLFDDACPLCNGAVRFVLARDGGRFGLLPLGSPLGQQTAQKLGLDPANPTSFALLQANRADFGANGVLQTLALLPGWGWARWLPSAPLEPLYRVVARWRYRLTAGRVCPVPSSAQRARLIVNLEQLPNFS